MSQEIFQLQYWTLIVQIGATITSIIVLIFNALSLAEMKRTRKANNRAHIVVGYEMDSENRFIYLFVQNIGELTATNIEVELSNSILLKDGKDARDILFGDTMRYLINRQKINTVLFPIYDIPDNENEDFKNTVKIKYRDIDGRKYDEEYDIDIRPYINRYYIDEKSVSSYAKDIAKEFKDLNKTLSRKK